MKVKVLEFDGYVDGRDREVTGVVNIDGADFKFILSTDDGMTSIYITDANGCFASAEDNDELADELGLTGFDDYEVYDEILSAVCEEYSLADD
jgi:hypothetical protein